MVDWKETDCKGWSSKGRVGKQEAERHEWKEAGTRLFTGKDLPVESIISYNHEQYECCARIYTVVSIDYTLIACLIAAAVAEAKCLVWSR